MKKNALYMFIFFVFSTCMFASTTIDGLRTEVPPKIDGVLDDLIWKQTKGYTEFISFQPEYGKQPKEKTVAFMAYDADNLYFGIKCYDKEPEKIIATLFKRDGANRDDKVVVYIDSRNNGQNAYYFVTNPLGIQADGILDSQAYSDNSQDFIWESAGTKNEDGYSVELKIPFQSLRFSKSKLVNMRIGFLRRISRYAEQYTFPDWRVGDGSIVDQLAQVSLENINSKRVFEILPSLTFMDRKSRNQMDKMESIDDKKINVGLTSKIGLTSDITLDVTVNPDFSHIESDEGQVDVNLRTDALYAEKRSFFLEGLEHFYFAGTGEESPVELAVNTRNIREPLLGIKLSGKAGKSGTLNSLFVIDKAKDVEPMDSSIVTDNAKNYFGVLRYKQLFSNDSYLGGMYTSKEFKGGFFRVAGVDSKFRINGSMTLEGYFLYSFKRESQQETRTEGNAYGLKLRYDTTKYMAYLGYHDVSRDFDMDPGRLWRSDIRIFSAGVLRNIFISSEVLKRIQINYCGSLSTDKFYDKNEYSHYVYTQFDFPASTWLRAGYELATEVYLNTMFKRNNFFIAGRAQATKYFYFTFDYSSGKAPHYSQLVQGDLNALKLSMQFQPSEKFSSEFLYTHHVFHEQSSKDKLYDISIYRNKTTYQLNKYLSFRAIVEYNSLHNVVMCDALAEFTYIPGTVIHLGYGPTFGKENNWGTISYQYDQFKLIGSALFFKASYLLRF